MVNYMCPEDEDVNDEDNEDNENDDGNGVYDSKEYEDDDKENVTVKTIHRYSSVMTMPSNLSS